MRKKHPAIENADRLGPRLHQAPFAERRGISVEADDLERVFRISATDEAEQGEGDLFSMVELAVAGHRAAHVEQQHSGAGGLIFRFVNDEIVLVDLDHWVTLHAAG